MCLRRVLALKVCQFVENFTDGNPRKSTVYFWPLHAWPLRVDDVIKSRVYHARMRTAEKSMRCFYFLRTLVQLV